MSSQSSTKEDEAPKTNYKFSANEETGEISFTFNINQDIGESKSGKSVLVTSTRGNKKISDLISSDGDYSEDFIKKLEGMKIGANIYKDKSKE